MGVDIRVGGAAEWNASESTVSEDSTPLYSSDTFGGVGAISFAVPEGVDAKSMLDKTVDLVDGARGVTQGVVKAVASRGDGNVTADALTRLSALVGDRTALPHIGTVESALLYYFGLCDVTTGIVIDETIGAVEVTLPGWYANVWDQVKKLGVAYGFETIPVGTDITVRPLRTITADRVRESAFAWSLDGSQLAQTVEAWFYPVAEIADALIVGNEQSIVSNVDAGEVLEFDIQLDASLSSIEQPIAVDAVEYGEASVSVYSVLDQFDEPVPAAVWEAQGGRVLVEISEDTRSLRVTVIGSQNGSRAPYRIAGINSAREEFSSLRVIGTGVSLVREKYTLPACTDERATSIVGAEDDNEFLTSWGHAHMVMLGTVRRHGTPSRRISGSAWHVLSSTDFDGQAYGNVAGARVFEDLNVYRIRSATITPGSVSYEAEVDTTFGDADAVAEGFTIAEYDAQWLDGPISEFDLRPLTPVGGVVVPPDGGLYPGSETFPSSTTFPGA
jgi:hypothetical protein